MTAIKKLLSRSWRAPSTSCSISRSSRRSAISSSVGSSASSIIIHIVLGLLVNLRMKALRRGEKAPQCRHDTGASQFGCRKVLRAIHIWLIRTEDSWVGDLIAAASVVVTLWGGLLIGHALSGGGQ